MSERKTIPVTEVIIAANRFLRLSSAEKKAERVAVAEVLEDMLWAANARREYRYLPGYGPQETGQDLTRRNYKYPGDE